MKIEIVDGRYGKKDKIILVTTTNIEGDIIEKEPISIFKLGVLINQITFNELSLKDGFKRFLFKKGEPLFIEEAIKEAINMAKKDINWAESHNWPLVLNWAKKWKLKSENVERELKRTFQTGIEEYE